MNITNDLKFLKDYLNTNSPSGYEEQAQQLWKDYIEETCRTNVEVREDHYGNVFATYKHVRSSSSIHLVLDSHADEIGFFVFDITDKGYIKIGRLGGSDITITGSAKAKIWPLTENSFKNKPITGVFGHPAIHVHGGDYEFDIDESFIDLGLNSRAEVEDLGVKIGSPITLSREFFIQGNYYSGKSLDDKIGGYTTAMILKNLSDSNILLDYDLTVVNSVQEEVGLHGTRMALHTLKEIHPNKDLQAIAIDVCHCTDSPAYSRKESGNVISGKGPAIMTAPSLHNTLTSSISKSFKESEIPLQYTASGRSSGTNADSLAYFGNIPTALLKIPLKYMHTTVEMAHKEDVNSLIKGLIEYIKNSFTTFPQTKELKGNKL